MLSNNLLIPTLDYTKNAFSCALNEEEDYLQAEFVQLMPDIALDTVVSHPDWISLQSSKLRKGVYIVQSTVFGKIIDVAVIEKTVVLCVLEYYGHHFNSHYNSFEITHHGVIKAVNLEALSDHRPVFEKHSFVDKSLYFLAVTSSYMHAGLFFFCKKQP